MATAGRAAAETPEMPGARLPPSALRQGPGRVRPFSYHRHELPILVAFICLVLIELLVMHWVMSLWSVRVAWTLSMLTSLVLIHVALLIRAMISRPILVDDEGVTVRCGLSTEVFLPLDILEKLENSPFVADAKGPSVLRTTLLAHPNVTLRLARPVPLRRLGLERLIDRVVLRLDEPEAFRADVEARRERAVALAA